MSALYYTYNGRPIVNSIMIAIFKELEQSLDPISRSRNYLMLNISETVRDTDIVSVEY